MFFDPLSGRVNKSKHELCCFRILKRVHKVYTAPVPPLGDWVSEAPPPPPLPPPTMNEDESFSGGVGNPSAEKTEDLFACRRGMNIRGEKAFSPRHTSTLAEAALPKLLASFVKALGLRIQDDDIEIELISL